MFFREYFEDEVGWLDGSGAASDLVISTRVRLARNLAGYRFPHHADESEARVILRESARHLLNCPSFSDGWSLSLADHSLMERKCLLEMHLASPALIRHSGDRSNRGLVIGRDLSRAVMINEEDHLRVQVFRSGFDPLGACQQALALDTEIEQEVDFAFSEDLGYLTSCPTNVGTGFRLSVLIHLPGLVLSGEIEKILNSLRQLQFAVRGLYGEGSTVRGALFQISNLSTLGRSEQQLTMDFERHVRKVIQYEKMVRDHLFRRDRVGIQDMTHRARAILANARLITAQEAVNQLSNVRLGVGLGILDPLPMAVLNRALIWHGGGHLQIWADRPVKGRERTVLRADYLRRLFNPDNS